MGDETQGGRATTNAKRIVLADDDSAALEGLRALLVAWGYEVDTASDGRAALALVAKIHPCAVITDVVMPEMTGLELLEAIHRDEPFIPVILLTAHTTHETLRCAAAHGALAHLPKPVNTATLKSLLNRAVRGADGGGES